MTADEAIGGMRHDVDERMADRRQAPPREPRAVMTGPVVQRREDDIQRLEDLVLEVQAAVRHDVHFDPVQDGQGGEAFADAVDLVTLPLERVDGDCS